MLAFLDLSLLGLRPAKGFITVGDYKFRKFLELTKENVKTNNLHLSLLNITKTDDKNCRFFKQITDTANHINMWICDFVSLKAEPSSKDLGSK